MIFWVEFFPLRCILAYSLCGDECLQTLALAFFHAIPNPSPALVWYQSQDRRWAVPIHYRDSKTGIRYSYPFHSCPCQSAKPNLCISLPTPSTTCLSIYPCQNPSIKPKTPTHLPCHQDPSIAHTPTHHLSQIIDKNTKIENFEVNSMILFEGLDPLFRIYNAHYGLQFSQFTAIIILRKSSNMVSLSVI